MTKAQVINCENPANGESIGSSPLHEQKDLDAMMARARQAQIQWSKLPIKERARYMKRVREYLVKNIDHIAQVISQDNGKTLMDAMATEVVPSTMAISYYIKNSPKFLKDKWIKPGNILFANKSSKITRTPFGVVGIISPWNYPFAIPFSEVVMAILAGNAVILKVATETQMVGLEIKKAFEYAKMPEGVFNFINIPGRVAGDAFLECGIDKLFFTGSVPIGKKLMAKAAQTLTPVSLELGGNDPMLVCDDANLRRAAAGALWGGFQNAGQSCGGVERIYVHKNVYDAFLEELKNQMHQLRIGKTDSFDTDIGSMTTSRQKDAVNRHVDDALSKGARIYASVEIGKGLTGSYLPARVLVDVNHDMDVMREETFGPVLGVMKVNSMEEAIALANDSDLGLTASVWSKDRKRAEHIARQVKAGALVINDHLMTHGLAETPWGGFKESGIGRTHGEIGFAEMTEPQVVVHDYLAMEKNLWWYPFSETTYKGVRGVSQFLYGTSIGERASGLVCLMRVFFRIFEKPQHARKNHLETTNDKVTAS